LRVTSSRIRDDHAHESSLLLLRAVMYRASSLSEDAGGYQLEMKQR
jgi:hypothetical protein